MPPEVAIDPEFRALIPPLSADQLRQIEDDRASQGCRDPLVVWHGFLLDGHNRHAICIRHGIPFDIVEVDLSDRDVARVWIIDNRRGRRDLNAFQRTRLGLLRKAIVAGKAQEDQERSGGRGRDGRQDPDDVVDFR